MSPLGALPSDIRPLDRSVPYVDERSGRSPRRGRAFPDPGSEDDDDATPKRRSPVPSDTTSDGAPAPEPVRPRVDVHVQGQFLPTRQLRASSLSVH